MEETDDHRAPEHGMSHDGRGADPLDDEQPWKEHRSMGSEGLREAHCEIPGCTAWHTGTSTPATFDEADNMCPNCVTPWKCNGPHLSEQTVSAQPAAGEGLREPIDVPISAADHPEHYRGGFRAGYRAALAAQPTAGEGLLRELDNLKPLYNANGPGVDRGKTFSGWEVPDWLMQRIRAALQPASEAPRGRLVELDVSTGKTTPLQPASEGDDQC